MIYKKMIEVMRDCDFISKSRNNTQQGFKFRGIDDVMNSLHSSMAKSGVFILTEAIGDPLISEKITQKGGTLFYVRQKWQFSFCAEDGSKVTATTIGEAMDSGDKGMNKSMSIALKYALLQAFLIPTEEEKDPDGNSHDIKPTNTDQKQAKQKNEDPKKEITTRLTESQIIEAIALIDSFGLDQKDILAGLKREKFTDLPADKFNGLIDFITNKGEEKKSHEPV